MVALLLLPLASSTQATELFLMAGQSNMVGGGREDEITDPAWLLQPDVAYRYQTDYGYQPDWIPLQNLVEGQSFGPELLFGRTLADAGHDVAIAKYAWNGTSLAIGWAPDSELRNGLLAFGDESLASTPELHLAGFIWVQGTGDTDALRGPLYEGRLHNLIAEVRDHFDVPDLPVLFNQYHIAANRPEEGILTLRQSQANVARDDPYAYMINLDDMPLKPDRIHFATITQEEAGIRLANAYRAAQALLGDVTMDGAVNGLDIGPFVNRLTTGSYQAEADTNTDGQINGLDVDSFVAAVLEGNGMAGIAAVPEPSALGLVVVCLVVALAVRRVA
jgi:hypothetical protein